MISIKSGNDKTRHTVGFVIADCVICGCTVYFDALSTTPENKRKLNMSEGDSWQNAEYLLL